MPIVKLDGLYFRFSTVVDAPTSAGLPLEEFKEWCAWRYGQEGLLNLETMLPHIEEHGTSERDATCPEESCWLNRAGLNETWLNRTQLVEYLRAMALDPNTRPPLGVKRDYSVDEDPRTSFEAFMGRAGS